MATREQQRKVTRRARRTESAVLKALERSQERLALALKAAGAGVFDWIITTGEVVWTEELERLYGLGPGSLGNSYNDWSRALHPEDRERVESSVQDCIRAKIPWETQYRIVRPDGQIRWIAAAGGVSYDEEGEPVRFLGVNIDITERKQTELELNRFFALSLDFLCIAGFDGYFKRLNPSWERFLGWTTEELLNRPYLDFVHPDDREATIREAQKLAEGHEVVSFENRYRHKDGYYRWLLWRCVPLIEQQAIYAVAHDMTGVRELQEAQLRAKEEEARYRSEAHYRELVENAIYGVYRAAHDGHLQYVNPALVEMLGYDSREELLEKSMATDVFLVPDERVKLVAEAFRTGRIEPAEVEWKRKDVKPIRVRLSGRVVRGQDGEFQAVEAIVENVTERRLLEEQYRQAQKVEAVGRLAGGIAHDFNNLLNVILGFSELLLDHAEGDKQRKQIEEIHKAGHRAATLTRQLLAFSRKQVLEPKVLDLNGIISDVGKMLHRLIGEDIKLVTVAAPDLGQVKADPGQIEQVILNLAVNARDAMPKGGKLTIETANVVLDENYARTHIPVVPGRYVMLAVSDTGVGMDADTQVRIFEPFFTTKKQGTGLGLATVYGIVKQSGGYIWVYSELGKGTTFKVYLPRVDAKAEVTGVQVSPEAAPRGSETVLLVEDSESLRAVAREFLERSGYTVLEALDGSEAVRMAEQRKTPIHLLLTDVVMPGMSGRDVAEQLKRRHPETKVLYMSGYTDNSIVHHGVLDEGVALLHKPFAADTLVRKVRQVLDS